MICPLLPESPSHYAKELFMYQDIFNPIRVSAQVGGKEIIFETGRMANQAHGSV